MPLSPRALNRPPAGSGCPPGQSSCRLRKRWLVSTAAKALVKTPARVRRTGRANDDKTLALVSRNEKQFLPDRADMPAPGKGTDLRGGTPFGV